MAFEQVILRTTKGQEYGPVPMATLAEWDRDHRVPHDATLVDAASGETRLVAEFPGLFGNTFGAAKASRARGTNPNAAWAFYCALCGLVPCLTPFLGLAAVVLGMLGVRDARRQGCGRWMAWTGILLGTVEIILAIWFIIAAASSSPSGGG